MTTTAPPRRIEYRRVRDLVANPVNPKKHDLDLIASSIDEHGYIEPVVEDGRTGRLISGHGRTETLAAMEAEGADPPDGVVIDAAGYWQVPVAVGWASRDDAAADGALVELNRAGELGGWDERKLLNLLTGLAEQDRLHAVGFGEEDLHSLQAQFAERTAPDEFPSYDDETIETQYECPRCAYRWSGALPIVEVTQ